MSTRKNRPLGAASEAGELTPSVPHAPEIRPLRSVPAAPVATFANGVSVDLLALTEGSDNPRYEVYLQGFAAGHESRQHEVDRLTWEAGRYYTEMCRRAPVPMVDPNRPSFAELERRRGNHEHAEQVEAANAARFAEVTS